MVSGTIESLERECTGDIIINVVNVLVIILLSIESLAHSPSVLISQKLYFWLVGLWEKLLTG